MAGLVSLLGQVAIWPLRVFYRCLLIIWTWVRVRLPWPATLLFVQQPYEGNLWKDLVSHLLREIQELKEQVLKQKVLPFRRSQKASGAKQTAPQKSAPWPSLLRRTTPDKDFCVQFRISGKTGGCEEKFLKDVSEHLSHQGVSLQAKEFAENSNDLLLLFCPISSRKGTDIENALEGIRDEQKVLLVVMDFIPQDNPGAFVDTRQRVPHPTMVLTVHTRFTLQDGFYPCEMNTAAVAHVAAAIKDHVKDQ